MTRSPLFGRRIHFSGSISPDLAVATTDDVKRARELVQTLAHELVARGATFVLPVDTEKTRAADAMPICFDWLLWQTLHSASLAARLMRPTRWSLPLNTIRPRTRSHRSSTACGTTCAAPT